MICCMERGWEQRCAVIDIEQLSRIAKIPANTIIKDPVASFSVPDDIVTKTVVLVTKRKQR